MNVPKAIHRCTTYKVILFPDLLCNAVVTFRNAGRVGSIAFRRLPSKNRPLQSDQSEAEEPEHRDAFCPFFV